MQRPVVLLDELLDDGEPLVRYDGFCGVFVGRAKCVMRRLVGVPARMVRARLADARPRVVQLTGEELELAGSAEPGDGQVARWLHLAVQQHGKTCSGRRANIRLVAGRPRATLVDWPMMDRPIWPAAPSGPIN